MKIFLPQHAIDPDALTQINTFICLQGGYGAIRCLWV